MTRSARDEDGDPTPSIGGLCTRSLDVLIDVDEQLECLSRV